jgi:hypothetical protein
LLEDHLDFTLLVNHIRPAVLHPDDYTFHRLTSFMLSGK